MILVVGGAGYVGSHVAAELSRRGTEYVVLDDLSTGHREAVADDVPFVSGDMADPVVLDELFQTYPVRAVMHFAARSLVGESVRDPGAYYRQNVAGVLPLLERARRAQAPFVFSSTAAVYGEPGEIPISEDAPLAPVSPYGRSKGMVESILSDYHAAYGLRFACLRYFNAAGADKSGRIGEDHRPETHLIPIVFSHILGQRDSVSVFGEDYPTRDGTCVRDYVHVDDLAAAHILVMAALKLGEVRSAVYNIGTGRGETVRDVILACGRAAGREAVTTVRARRAGDPAQLVADPGKIRRELGFSAVRTLDEIADSAWRWHREHPRGYGESRGG